MSKRNIVPRSGKQLYLNQLFLRGMLYTTSELNEGYAKVITNFDISPTGDSAVPRKAFKSYEINVGGSPITNKYFYACKFLQSVNSEHYISFENTITESEYVSHNEGDNASVSRTGTSLGIKMYSRYNNAFNPTTVNSISVYSEGSDTSNLASNQAARSNIETASFVLNNGIVTFNGIDINSLTVSEDDFPSLHLSERILFNRSNSTNIIVNDGDSGTLKGITVENSSQLDNNMTVFPFRLACINCPEYTEEWHDYGKAVLNRLFRLSTDSKLYYTRYDSDIYGRNIIKAYIKIINGSLFDDSLIINVPDIYICINELIVFLGLAKVDYVLENVTDSNLVRKLVDIQLNCTHNMFSDSDIDPYYNYARNIVSYPRLYVNNVYYNSGSYYVQAIKLDSTSYPSNKVSNKIDRVETIYDDNLDAIGFLGRLVSNAGKILYKGPMYVRAKALKTYDESTETYTYNNPNFSLYLPDNNLNGRRVDIIKAATSGYNLLDSKLFHVEDIDDKTKQFSILGLSVTDTNIDSVTLVDQAVRNQVVRLNASINSGYFYNKSITSTEDYGMDLKFELVNDNTLREKDFNYYICNDTKNGDIEVKKELNDSEYTTTIPVELIYYYKKPCSFYQFSSDGVSTYAISPSESGVNGEYSLELYDTVTPTKRQLVSVPELGYLVIGDNLTEHVTEVPGLKRFTATLYGINTLPDTYDPVIREFVDNEYAFYYYPNSLNVEDFKGTKLSISSLSFSIFREDFHSGIKNTPITDCSFTFTQTNGRSPNSSVLQVTDAGDLFDVRLFIKDAGSLKTIISTDIITNGIGKKVPITIIHTKVNIVVCHNLTNLNKEVSYTNNTLKLVDRISSNRTTHFFSKWEYSLNGENDWKTISESSTPTYIMDASRSNYVEKSTTQLDDVTWEIPVSGNIMLKHTVTPKLVSTNNTDSYLNEIVNGEQRTMYITNNLQEISLTMPMFKISDSIVLIKEKDIRENVDIKNATRIGIFNRQAYLYGPYTKSNFLQFSKFEDPWYYPFPYYNIEFDEPITYVTTFRNNLIVFTKYNIWSLSGSESILECTKSKIYENLSTSLTDIHLVTTVGKYLMFFNNNMGYLIVPNDYSFATDNSNIKVYKLTENVINLLSNPEHYLRTRIGIPPTAAITSYINCEPLSYTQNNEIYIVLNYTINYNSTNIKFVVMLVYNIDYKYWKIYDVKNTIFDEVVDTYVCEPSYNTQFITRHNDNVSLTVLDNTNNNSCIDRCYRNDIEQGITDIMTFESNISTYIESGYLSVDTMNDKRFKDLIIEFDRLSGDNPLTVNCNFYIDGSPVLINDVDAVIVDKTLNEVITKPVNALEIKDSNIAYNLQNYDGTSDVFKQYYGVVYRIGANDMYYTSNRTHLRIPIYGKGRLPSFSLEMIKSDPYEFINYSIIYKEKNINTRR